MKTIIAGCRNFYRTSVVFDAVAKSGFKISEVVSGGASGVDRIGEHYADVNKIICRKFPADWDLFGKSAGAIRNREMADYADALIAVWDGKSRGTKNMIETMTELGKLVHVHKI